MLMLNKNIDLTNDLRTRSSVQTGVMLIKAEFIKMKRYHILLIGIIGMTCSPVLQLFTQSVVAEEYKNPHYDLAALLDSTIWGNATIFMPVLLTLVGGYLINREYADDTLKNILTVPCSFRKMLAGKLAVIGLLAILAGIYSFLIAAAVGLCAGLTAGSFPMPGRSLLQMIGLSIGIYLVVLPFIIFNSRRPGKFMSGSIIAFLFGYSCMFFKTGILRDIYPVSAVFTLIGFDTADWAGTSGKGNLLLGLVSVGSMVLLSGLLFMLAKEPETFRQVKRKKGKRGGRRTAGRMVI